MVLIKCELYWCLVWNLKNFLLFFDFKNFVNILFMLMLCDLVVWSDLDLFFLLVLVLLLLVLLVLFFVLLIFFLILINKFFLCLLFILFLSVKICFLRFVDFLKSNKLVKICNFGLLFFIYFSIFIVLLVLKIKYYDLIWLIEFCI